MYGALLITFLGCLCVQVSWGMEHKSLCEYFNINSIDAHLKNAPLDIKKLLAQYYLGTTGWWYLDRVHSVSRSSCKSVALSDDNDLLAIGYESAGISVRDSEDNVIWSKNERLKHEFGYHSSIAFKPGTRMLAVLCSSETVDAWNLQNIQYLKGSAPQLIKSSLAQQHYNMHTLAFSKDGSQFVTHTATSIDCWRSDCTLISSIPIVFGECHSAISPDNSFVAVVGHNLTLWKPHNKTHITKINPHQTGYRAVAFHPYENLLVTIASHNETLNALWDCSQGVLDEPLFSLSKYPGKEPRTVIFHPQGHSFAIGYQENGIVFFNLRGERILRIDYEHHDPLSSINKSIIALAMNVKGNRLVAACNNPVVPDWRKFESATIDQVLLRLVLKLYVEGCIKSGQYPEFPCIRSDDVAPWMAAKFNLKEDEVTKIWNSIPSAVRSSIMRTMIWRAQRIPSTTNIKNLYYEF